MVKILSERAWLKNEAMNVSSIASARSTAHAGPSDSYLPSFTRSPGTRPLSRLGCAHPDPAFVFCVRRLLMLALAIQTSHHDRSRQLDIRVFERVTAVLGFRAAKPPLHGRASTVF